MYKTSKNMSCHKPFLLAPAGKDYFWGGDRLRTEYGKQLHMEPLAETWECSVHEDGLSMVASGEYQGSSLRFVLEKHPEFLGTHPCGHGLPPGALPILIKLIDSKKKLSVQVHPDDLYARQIEQQPFGKTEMWYILDAKKGTKLIYGFHHDMEEDTLRKSMENGTISKYLQKVEVKKDDVFFIEAGTVHALGAGALIAEIQESSNLTYRLFDYNRKDKDGNLRPLHQEKALAVMNRKGSAAPRQPLRVLKYKRYCASEFLCRCKYFQVERLLMKAEDKDSFVPVKTGANSFQVLLCIEGSGTLFIKNEEIFSYKKGQCIFIPANSEELLLHGSAQFLFVSC